MIQSIRARHRILLGAESLCFTYGQIPHDFTVLRPGCAHRPSAIEVQAVSKLPDEATFLCQNYCAPEALLVEGLA